MAVRSSGKMLAIAYILIIGLFILYVKLINLSGGNSYVSFTKVWNDFWNKRQSKENIKHILKISKDETSNLNQIFQNYDQSASIIGTPMIFHYLPHLNNSLDSLQPIFSTKISRKNVWLVMGIATVFRNGVDYLTSTVESLISNLQPEQQLQCIIIICVTEIDKQDYYQQVLTNFQSKFLEHLESGLIEVIASPASFYPNLTRAAPLFGDSLKRAKWRRKQNLDYIFLMMYARGKGEYYMQLEDDIIAEDNYFTEIHKFATNLKSNEWIVIYFSKLGFIGKFFRSASLFYILEFLLMFYQEKPCDWLLMHYIEMLTCDGYNINKECEAKIKLLRIKYSKPLFQHMGKLSSLEGKMQTLQEQNFGGKNPSSKSKFKSSNPPAVINTTLKTHSGSLQLLYDGNDELFWGKNPRLGDVICVNFRKPARIEKYAFFSGNSDHPGDKLLNAELQILNLDIFRFIESSKKINPSWEEDDKNQLIFNKNGETYYLERDGFLPKKKKVPTATLR